MGATTNGFFTAFPSDCTSYRWFLSLQSPVFTVPTETYSREDRWLVASNIPAVGFPSSFPSIMSAFFWTGVPWLLSTPFTSQIQEQTLHEAIVERCLTTSGGSIAMCQLYRSHIFGKVKGLGEVPHPTCRTSGTSERWIVSGPGSSEVVQNECSLSTVCLLWSPSLASLSKYAEHVVTPSPVCRTVGPGASLLHK